MPRLENRTAIITGGAGVIGRKVSSLFLKEGAYVLLVDIDESGLQNACEDLSSNRCSYFVGDVTSAVDNDSMVETATERYGGVDIFLANAGVEGEVKPIVDYNEAKFDQVMAINVKAPFLGLKSVIPAMQKRGGGNVVITSSVAGVSATPNLSAYGTSKHAVIGLMRAAARECAPFNIRVNTVNPAPVYSRMIRSIEEGLSPDGADEIRAAYEERIPMNKYAEPEDIARAMLYLASDDSHYVTGSVHMVDGGMTS